MPDERSRSAGVRSPRRKPTTRSSSTSARTTSSCTASPSRVSHEILATGDEPTSQPIMARARCRATEIAYIGAADAGRRRRAQVTIMADKSISVQCRCKQDHGDVHGAGLRANFARRHAEGVRLGVATVTSNLAQTSHMNVSTAIAITEQPLRAQIDRVEAEARRSRAQSARHRRASSTRSRRSASNTAARADVCESLEKLRELGAQDLFWGDAAAIRDALQPSRPRARAARGSREQVKVIEEQRQALLDDIKAGPRRPAILEGDLFESQEEEEERRNEWVVEREIGPIASVPQRCRGSRGGEDDRRFRKICRPALLPRCFSASSSR